MNPGIFSNFNNRQNSLSGSNYTYLYGIEIYSSTTWKAPADGILELLVFGAGGSGGISGGSFTQDPRATGGCGGGTSYKKFKVKAGDSYDIVIGAGGASRTHGSFYNNFDGLAGGTTSVTGRGCNIVIPGGLGGKALLGVTGPITVQPRSIPSGGDLNLAGGVAGSIDFSTFEGGRAYATGGAGASLFTQYPDSGSITVRASSGAGSATGGAGMYPSGNITISINTITGGGGSYGPSPANSTTGGAGLDNPLTSIKDNILNVLNFSFNITENGSAASYTSTSSGRVTRYGGGSGAISFYSTGGSAVVSGSALLGGTGGVSSNVNINDGEYSVSGTSSYVGGSGGIAQVDNSATGYSNIQSGTGGKGLALLAFYVESKV